MNALRILTLSLLLAIQAIAEEPPRRHEVVRLADGVFAMIWDRGSSTGNNLIVVNDDDVLVVDSAIVPSMARQTIAEVGKLTDKPVRWLVNTHWHDDHVWGNGAWKDAYPGIEIIAHPLTRVDAQTLGFGTLETSIAGIEEQAATLERWLETGKDDAGTEVTSERRGRIESLLADLRFLASDAKTIRPELPTALVADALVLQRGERTIEIRHLGLGNTRGDLVVVLPNERIAAVGDLLVHPSPYGIGSYYREWIVTLGRVAALEADVLLPGHGPPLRDRRYLETVQALLRSLAEQVEAAVAEGATLEQTQERVTLAEWKETFAAGDVSIERAFDAYFVKPAVERMWRQARGEPDVPKGLD